MTIGTVAQPACDDATGVISWTAPSNPDGFEPLFYRVYRVGTVDPIGHTKALTWTASGHTSGDQYQIEAASHGGLASSAAKSQASSAGGVAIDAPADTATLTSAFQVFTLAGTDDEVQLWAGSSLGASDHFDSGVLTNNPSSITATGLPENGATIYVRLRHRVTAGAWTEIDYTYTAAANGFDTAAYFQVLDAHAWGWTDGGTVQTWVQETTDSGYSGAGYIRANGATQTGNTSASAKGQHTGITGNTVATKMWIRCKGTGDIAVQSADDAGTFQIVSFDNPDWAWIACSTYDHTAYASKIVSFTQTENMKLDALAIVDSAETPSGPAGFV